MNLNTYMCRNQIAGSSCKYTSYKIAKLIIKCKCIFHIVSLSHKPCFDLNTTPLALADYRINLLIALLACT